MREAAQIDDDRMAQFALKVEKLSYIIGPRGSQDLRSRPLLWLLMQHRIARCRNVSRRERVSYID